MAAFLPTVRCACAAGFWWSAGMRVLVIDDQEDAAFLLCQLVKSRGSESRYCTSAVQSVDIARAWQPEVILLDLRMPGIDGYCLAPMLRGAIEGAAPRIILVSGYLPEQEKLTAAAIDGFLLKPVRLQEMTELLHRRADTGQASHCRAPHNLASIFLPVDPAIFQRYLQE
jgi:CheY-like chemotaxis protein